jgi:hypothetical protein
VRAAKAGALSSASFQTGYIRPSLLKGPKVKTIMLALSDAQFERLQNIAAFVEETPERIIVGQAFAALDGWDDDASSFLETLESAMDYVYTGAATMNADRVIETNLPVALVIEEARAIAAVGDAS